MATADRQPAAPEAGPARRRHRRRPGSWPKLEEERPPHGGPASQVAAALVAMAVGIFGGRHGRQAGPGGLAQPGPGLWPFAISVVVIVLSAVLLVVGRHGRDTEQVLALKPRRPWPS